MVAVAVVPVFDDIDPAAPGSPYALPLDGLPLLAHAVRHLDKAGLTTIVSAGPGVTVLPGWLGDSGRTEVIADAADLQAAWSAARDRQGVSHVLVHDPCCPLLGAEAIEDALDRAAADPDAVIVLSRPVTDTVKIVVGGEIHQTLPREQLREVTSPVVVPVALCPPELLVGVRTLVGLLDQLASRGARVLHVDAPATGRVVHDGDGMSVLRALRDLAGSTSA